MAIQFEDLIIDRTLQGIFENSLGDIIGGVNQLQNVSIETTSETKDKTDAVGALIMRFFTSKSRNALQQTNHWRRLRSCSSRGCFRE